VGWVVTLLVRVAGWPGRLLGLDAMSLRVVAEETIEEPPPKLVATTEAPENVSLLRRGGLVEVDARPIGSVPRPHLCVARRTARGPPLPVRRSALDEVHDTESPDPKEKTC
jgi:hypothetical protein